MKSLWFVEKYNFLAEAIQVVTCIKVDV